MKDYSSTAQKIATIKALWNEWALTFGAATVTVVASTLVPSIWLAVLVAVISRALNSLALYYQKHRRTGCMRFATLMAKALFASAIIMVAINILLHTPLMEKLFNPATINTTIPFIASLIIFPSVAVFCAYGLCRGVNSKFCQRCKEIHGYSPEEGFIGNFFHTQTRRQLRMMLALSLLISVVDWSYYAIFYINVNLNAPDKFFFIVFPVSIYLLSLFYIGQRYFAIAEDITINDRINSGTHTLAARENVARFLIVRDDRLLLCPGEHNLFDTPAETSVSKAEGIDDKLATSIFEKLSGVSADKFSVRKLYQNLSKTYQSTFYHYLVEIKGTHGSALPEGWKFRGIWTSLAEIDRLIKLHAISPALGAEIHRVYTLTMAHKTYDAQGRRLYPIKNYKPTFRLCDINKWDIDYDDVSWFDIANNNQDTPFWRLRNLWRRASEFHHR